MGDGGSRNCADVSTTPMGASPHFCSARAKKPKSPGFALAFFSAAFRFSSPFIGSSMMVTGRSAVLVPARWPRGHAQRMTRGRNGRASVQEEREEKDGGVRS